MYYKPHHNQDCQANVPSISTTPSYQIGDHFNLDLRNYFVQQLAITVENDRAEKWGQLHLVGRLCYVTTSIDTTFQELKDDGSLRPGLDHLAILNLEALDIAGIESIYKTLF